MLVILNHDPIEAVKESVLIVANRPGFSCDFSFSGHSELRQNHLDVLSPRVDLLRRNLGTDLLSSAIKAVFACIRAARARPNLITKSVEQFAEPLEVRLPQELFIFDEVFDLVPVVCLE